MAVPARDQFPNFREIRIEANEVEIADAVFSTRKEQVRRTATTVLGLPQQNTAQRMIALDAKRTARVEIVDCAGNHFA